MWLPQQCWCISRLQQICGSYLSSTGRVHTAQSGTGEVGVLGRFGKGGTSIQYMQGNKSGGISVEPALTMDNGCFLCSLVGGTEVEVVKDLARNIRFGSILRDGRVVIFIVFFLFSKNLVILTTLLKTFEGLL